VADLQMKRRKVNPSQKVKRRKLNETETSTLGELTQNLFSHLKYLPRHDMHAMKEKIIRQMGEEKSCIYFEHLKKFIAAKLTKWELDYIFLKHIGHKYIPLHNEFLTKLLYNAQCHELPPPKKEKRKPRRKPPPKTQASKSRKTSSEKKAPRKTTNIKGSSKTKTKSKSKKKRKKRTKSEQKPAKRAQIKSIPATYHFTSVKPFFTKPHKPPPESRKLIINPPSPVFDPPKFEEEKHDVTFIPTQKLPDIQEIHRRVTTSAKEEKVNVDMRVPLLLRAAMNKMVTKKLQRLPIDRRAEKAGCWCDVLWEGNRRLYKNSLFRKHWQNCKRQNHLPFARSILWQTDKMSNESI